MVKVKVKELNKLCVSCKESCKQSNKIIIVGCPHYNNTNRKDKIW